MFIKKRRDHGERVRMAVAPILDVGRSAPKRKVGTMAKFELVKATYESASGKTTAFRFDGQGIELTTHAEPSGRWIAVLRPALSPAGVRGWTGQGTEIDAFREAAKGWQEFKLPAVDWALVEHELKARQAL